MKARLLRWWAVKELRACWATTRWVSRQLPEGDFAEDYRFFRMLVQCSAELADDFYHPYYQKRAAHPLSRKSNKEAQ